MRSGRGARKPNVSEHARVPPRLTTDRRHRDARFAGLTHHPYRKRLLACAREPGVNSAPRAGKWARRVFILPSEFQYELERRQPGGKSGTSTPRKMKTAGRQRADSSPPRRTLPGYRSRSAQQINILLALADLDTGHAPVQRAALAGHVGMGAATVGDCMAFLADVQLVEAGRGQYAVTEQGRAFAEAWRRDSARARLLLRPLLRAHWAATAAQRHLADGPLPQEELGKRLRRGLPGVPARGQYMVEWLVIALVVERDERLHVRLPAAGPATSGSREAGPAEEEQAGPGEDTTRSGDSARRLHRRPARNDTPGDPGPARHPLRGLPRRGPEHPAQRPRADQLTVHVPEHRRTNRSRSGDAGVAAGARGRFLEPPAEGSIPSPSTPCRHHAHHFGKEPAPTRITPESPALCPNPRPDTERTHPSPLRRTPVAALRPPPNGGACSRHACGGGVTAVPRRPGALPAHPDRRAVELAAAHGR